ALENKRQKSHPCCRIAVFRGGLEPARRCVMEAPERISRQFRGATAMPMLSRQRATVTSRRTPLLAAIRAGSMGALAAFLALCLDANSPVRAQSDAVFPKCPNSPGAICTMTIKIFNNDDRWIFPVLTTGKGPKDEWMQAWFGVLRGDGTKPYPRRKNYRLYINPTTAGIPPNTGVSLTLPLFTQLENSINPNPPGCDPNPPSPCTDTFIDWWNGVTLQIYISPVASAPDSLLDALARSKPSTNKVNGKDLNRTQKEVIPNVANPIVPTCLGA